MVPAIVANPPVITEFISELLKKDMIHLKWITGLAKSHLVMVGRYGLISKGASVWPRKMFAAAFIDSAAVVPTVTYRSQPEMICVRKWQSQALLLVLFSYPASGQQTEECPSRKACLQRS